MQARRFAAVVVALVAGWAVTGHARGDVQGDGTLDALLRRYEDAWESRNPFELVDLAAPGSDCFDALLESDRFDQIARTAVELADVTVVRELAHGGALVELTKTQEDQFRVGTVTRGVARFALTVVRAPDGQLQIARHELLEPAGAEEGAGTGLSSNPATWADDRPPGERLFYLAHAHVLAGRFEEAHDLLANLLALPQSASRLDEVRYMLGNQLFFAQVHYLRGVAAQRTGRHEEGVEQMELALGVNPDFPLAMDALADEALARGEFGRAIELWTRSLELAPGRPAVEARLDFAIAARDHYPDADRRAQFLAVRGLPPDKAIDALTVLLRSDRRNTETRRRLAAAYLLNFDPESAEKVLLEGELLRPEDLETHYLLGRTYLAMRRPDDAVASFAKVWAKDPDHGDTLLYLAELNAAQHRFRNAVGYLKEALRRRPRDPVILFKLGVFSLKAGQRFDALGYLREARENHPPEAVRRELRALFRQYE